MAKFKEINKILIEIDNDGVNFEYYFKECGNEPFSRSEFLLESKISKDMQAFENFTKYLLTND